MEELKILEDNMSVDQMSKDTIRNYKRIIKKFVSSNEDIFEYAEKMKYRDEVSHFKSAIKQLYNIDKESIEKLEEIHNEKVKRRRKSRDQVQLKNVWRTVNAIRNKKLKLAFRLSFVSGLRIKELSEIKKTDLLFDEEEKKIIVHVSRGKGNKSRDIWTMMPDEYLYKNLKELIKDLKDNDQVFYSRSYLGAMAVKYGFKNHDLRANVAQMILYGSSEDSKTVIKQCQDYLGHKTDTKTYLYYKSRNINQTGTKFDV